MRPFRLIPFVLFLLLLLPSGLFAEVLAREGKGYLERVDGQLVLHLKGTHYEIGYQHGKLLESAVKKNIKSIIDNDTEKGEELAYQIYKVLRHGMHSRLMEFIPQRFLDEMRGIADGAGLEYREVVAGNLFPEAFHCSGFSLHGKATHDGSLYHVRILDFMTDMGFQDTAVVMMVEPEDANAFLNVGFAGFMGSVTGMNEKQVSIGEMGGMGQGHWDGLPMSLLIRDALERADTLDDAMTIFQSTPRTCEYYYVLADGKIPDSRGVYATEKQIHFVKPGEPYALFNVPQPPADDSGYDKSLVLGAQVKTTEWQTMIEDGNGMMLGMLNKQPDDCVLISGPDRFVAFSERLEGEYGKINETLLKELIKRPVSMKSNLHNVIFHPATLEAWVAVAAEDGSPACDQQYYHYKLTKQDDVVQTSLAK